MLAELGGRADEDRGIGLRDVERRAGLNHPLDRTLELREPHGGIVEFAGAEKGAERLGEVVVVGTKLLGEGVGRGGVGLGRDEIGPQFFRDKLGAARLGEGELDHVVSVEGARLVEDRLVAEIVLLAGEDKRTVAAARRAVAGERAGGFAQIGLGVVALAEREEFEEFAGEIFVGDLAVAADEVQPFKHRGVAGNFLEEVAERAKGAGA